MKAVSVHCAIITWRRGGEQEVGALTIRNVDGEVIAALKARARANHRSLEGELRYLLSHHAVPGPGLGVVRERARMAAAYREAPTPRNTPAGKAGPTADPLVDVRADGGEWMGAMSDMGEIVGDIVSPATEPSDWDVLRADSTARKDGPAS